MDDAITSGDEREGFTSDAPRRHKLRRVPGKLNQSQVNGIHWYASVESALLLCQALCARGPLQALVPMVDPK